MEDLSALMISSLSKEPVMVPVFAKLNGAVVDPTADVVTMAFVQGGVNPAAGDWKTAAWETDAVSVPPIYFARCEVGPGGTITLAAGTYQVWVKITDAVDIPVKQVGTLVVT